MTLEMIALTNESCSPNQSHADHAKLALDGLLSFERQHFLL
jgi:hypothetical protein